jgi:tRNA uridine 5-carboxymethylaminomethyl modification enzyme
MLNEKSASSTGTMLKPEKMPDYIWDTVLEQVNIQIKYEGYISIQKAQAEVFRKMENRPLPMDLDYESINGLRIEARQKLSALRPVNFGQASRITGISPADLAILMVHLKGR